MGPLATDILRMSAGEEGLEEESIKADRSSTSYGLNHSTFKDHVKIMVCFSDSMQPKVGGWTH
jgi:hypothetical protein